MSDALTMSLLANYFGSPSGMQRWWHGPSIYEKDTIYPLREYRDSSDLMFRELPRARNNIWRDHRGAFFAMRHDHGSQREVEKWARLFTALQLWKFMRQVDGPEAGDHAGSVASYVADSAKTLSAWQAAFLTTSTDPVRLREELVSLQGNKDRLQQAAQAYAESIAGMLDDDDAEAAQNVRCLYREASTGLHVSQKSLWQMEALNFRPRNRSFVEEISRVASQYPKAPLLVIVGADHVPNLRAHMYPTGLSSWDVCPAGNI